VRSAVRFQLPPELEAASPPEARGLRRDHVRLLAVDRATVWHPYAPMPAQSEPLLVRSARVAKRLTSDESTPPES